jgi:hypothetical protein
LDFYDIAYPGALSPGGAQATLGFKRIFAIGREIRLVDTDEAGRGSPAGALCMGRAGEALCAAAKASPRAICIRDYRIDRKLVETMRERELTLCIGLDRLMAGHGLARSRAIYMASKLLRYAMGRRLRIAFATLAGSEELLASPMQIIEVARLLGADERTARAGAGEAIRAIFE